MTGLLSEGGYFDTTCIARACRLGLAPWVHHPADGAATPACRRSLHGRAAAIWLERALANHHQHAPGSGFVRGIGDLRGALPRSIRYGSRDAIAIWWSARRANDGGYEAASWWANGGSASGRWARSGDEGSASGRWTTTSWRTASLKRDELFVRLGGIWPIPSFLFYFLLHQNLAILGFY